MTVNMSLCVREGPTIGLEPHKASRIKGSGKAAQAVYCGFTADCTEQDIDISHPVDCTMGKRLEISSAFVCLHLPVATGTF
jgi:hypothetical protein